MPGLDSVSALDSVRDSVSTLDCRHCPRLSGQGRASRGLRMLPVWLP